MCSKIWKPENSALFTLNITVVCKFELLNEAGCSDCSLDYSTLDESDNVTFFYFAGGLNTATPIKTTMAMTMTMATRQAVHTGIWGVLSPS